MTIYGIASIQSENKIVTKLFTNLKDCIDYINKKYQIPKKRIEKLNNNDTINVTIYGKTTGKITFIKKEISYDIINRNDYIATKLWCDEDIRMRLIDTGYEGSDENVKAVKSTNMLRHLEEYTDEDWLTIDGAIHEALGKTP